MMVSARMEFVSNRSSGFDYIRIILASAIICWHTLMTSYGAAMQLRTPLGLRILVLAILPMFFSLSGFLVAGSLERSRELRSFFGLRILRIVPALSAEVTLSALLLGPLLTSVTLTHYFSSPMFWSYFLNIVGEIHYVLPGLFHNNPVPDFVNLQLWTIPYELECYIVLGVLAGIGLLRKPAFLLLLLIAAQAVFAFHGFHEKISADRITVGGPMLVLCFLFGVAIHVFRKKIPYHLTIGVTAGLLMLTCLCYPSTRYLSALPAAYLTIYLGLLNPPRLPLIFSGDYSYGLYLYGYPIQQAVAHFPVLRHWYLNILIAFPLTIFCAIGSWWLLEKRALTLRRYLKPRRPLASPGP